jgi:hypothetical protein
MTLAFLGEAVMMMMDFGPVKEPSLISTVEVRSPLVNTNMLVFDLTAVTVVHPAFGYSAWKKA